MRISKDRSACRVAGALATALVALSPANAQDSQLGEIVPTLTFVHIASDFSPLHGQLARALAVDYRELGLDLQLEARQVSAFASAITVGGQLETIALGVLGGDPDRMAPNFWLEQTSYCEARYNAARWCDDTYDGHVDAFNSATDDEARRVAANAAQEYFISQQPWWHVLHPKVVMVYNSDKWENVLPSSPVPPHDTVLHPWLDIKPKGDDRILDYAFSEEVSTYNVLSETGAKGWFRYMYDTLVRLDGGRIVPWAAESWNEVDATTLDVKLREDMTFHDGEKVTAEDVAFTINYIKQHELPQVAQYVGSIDSAEVTGDYAVRIKLNRQDPNLIPRSFTAIPIVPEHIWSKVEDPANYDPVPDDAVIGSGPFKFVRWVPDQVHELATHTDHWAAPAYDGLRKLALGQADAVTQAMISGQADITNRVLPDADAVLLAENNDNLGYIEIPTANTMMVYLNTTGKPFDDVALRQALRLATNKQRGIQEGWLGYAVPASDGPILNSLTEWYDSDLPQTEFDLEKARELLREAGYGWDSDGRLHYPPAN